MSASVHKLTAGNYYLYLIRDRAAGDATHRGRASLSDYYTSKGESPGRWMGRGLAGLGRPVGRDLSADPAPEVWRVDAGSDVTEDQMKALFGLGMHPNSVDITKHVISQGAPKAAGLAAARLGTPFVIRDGASELQRRQAIAYRDHNLIRRQHWSAPIEDEVQTEITTTIARELFVAEYGREPADDRELSGYIARETRDPTTSVAGYDVTFKPVKSVSVLWALAPLDVANVIEECHDRAVADALEFLQDHAAFTRIGSGGVAQIDTEGFIAAAFTHRDSRAGDPHLHTHVAISNKVLATGADGIPRWLALDGRPFYKAIVAASELYNTRLEAHLIEALGLSFAERAQQERGKQPVREVVGIGTDLIDLFSSRLKEIEARYAVLAKQFHTDQGREPTLKESMALYKRAHLDTRQAKHEPRSFAEQRRQWREQTVALLGGVAELTAMLGRVFSAGRQAPQEVTPEWVAEQAEAVIETVAAKRSIWQRTHVLAEAQRRERAANAHAGANVAERITDAALAQYSMAYARDVDADLGEPEVLRRRDGASVYSTHGTQTYTSAAVVAAERRILAAAQSTDGRRVGEQSVGLSLLEAHANGRPLNAGQEALVRDMATSGARIQLALAPAGTGKTTAMAALARAWQEEGGRVVGLASSATAAKRLRTDMAEQGMTIDVDTVDKLVWLTRNPDARNDPARSWFDRINKRTLIIVDEAGKSGTVALDTVIATALARRASVRLIGDDKQLASIAAGGILTDIAATVGAVTLTEVMRFDSRAEAAATLALREGDPTGLAFYADNHRIHVANDQTAADLAFSRWQEDLAKGWDSQLLAPTNEIVNDLNARARLHRLAGDTQQPCAVLSDGLNASVGDIVSTRTNNRELRLRGGRDFVRNGDRWQVTKVHRDGTLTATILGSKHKVTLPARYVAEHTTLGYAATIDAIQGDTIGSRSRPGTCHVVGSDMLSRQQFYTAMSRATAENHVYLSTAETDAHQVLSPKATHPETAIDVLTRVLARDDAQVSATTAQRLADDPFRRLGPDAARYLDAVGQAAEHVVDPAVLHQIDTQADTVHTGLTNEAAWPVLRRHLAILALAGDDPIQRLTNAAARCELDTAWDAAAVLDWRLDYSGAHHSGTGVLPWLPAIPAALDEHPRWGKYLRRRSDLIGALTGEIHAAVQEWTQTSAPVWARPLLAADPELTAKIAIFRAAVGVDDADTRLTGPVQYAVRTRKMQNTLERRAAERIGRESPDTSRWHTIIDAVDPRIRRDSYWTQFAKQLTTVSRTGVNVSQLLTDAAAQGPLPDEMPAASLWFRIRGTLSPATLEAGKSTRLRPVWLPDLHAVFGSVLAETIAADPAFPGLVAAVAAADPRRWRPRDLLQVADEHLRDVAVQLRPDEYARLMTYSIDLFATANPFDRAVPMPTEPPMAAEEEEELSQQQPDQRRSISDEALLRHLGVSADVDDQIVDVTEIADEAAPPDPFDIDLDTDTEMDGLEFGDLSTTRPAPPPLSDALADVHGLRAAYQSALDAYDELSADVRIGNGPAIREATPRIVELRALADADRPYWIAIADVMIEWQEAEEAYERAAAELQAVENRLEQLRNTPGVDELDLLSAANDVKWYKIFVVPPISPAEKFYPLLSQARQARAEAAGGADKIVSNADVDKFIREVQDEDDRAVAAAWHRCRELGRALERAEAQTARAFAEAQIRNADHIVAHRDELMTELKVLNVAGGITSCAAGLPLSAAATKHLDPLAARAVSALAKYDRTVTPVLAGDDRFAAMAVLYSAAKSTGRKVMWCAPTAELVERASAADVADIAVSVAEAHRRAKRMPPDAILVVDHAAAVDPKVIADLAKHAEKNQARIILLDSGEQRWTPGPSSGLLRLLHADLPWSVAMSTITGVPGPRVPPPDLDSILVQAARFDRSLLPADIVEALKQRSSLRQAHHNLYDLDRDDWSRSVERDQSRDNGLEL